MSTTGFADALTTFADRLMRDTEATAARNVWGAPPDGNGVTMAAWIKHYDAQLLKVRDLAKATADHRVRFAESLPASVPQLAASDVLTKAWDDLGELRKNLASEGLALAALAERITGYLARPALRPGETGARMHLVGRAIH